MVQWCIVNLQLNRRLDLRAEIPRMVSTMSLRTRHRRWTRVALFLEDNSLFSKSHTNPLHGLYQCPPPPMPKSYIYNYVIQSCLACEFIKYRVHTFSHRYNFNDVCPPNFPVIKSQNAISLLAY